MENTALKESESSEASSQDILVVVSKIKSYIRAKSGMNTSGGVANALSAIVKTYCDSAVESAKKDGRKTVMERDFASTTTTTTGCC